MDGLRVKYPDPVDASWLEVVRRTAWIIEAMITATNTSD